MIQETPSKIPEGSGLHILSWILPSCDNDSTDGFRKPQRRKRKRSNSRICDAVAKGLYLPNVRASRLNPPPPPPSNFLFLFFLKKAEPRTSDSPLSALPSVRSIATKTQSTTIKPLRLVF